MRDNTTKQTEDTMTTLTIKRLDSDTDNNGNVRKWYEITGTDVGTNCEFNHQQFALTADGTILDSNGCPMTESDHETIAVRRAIETKRTARIFEEHDGYHVCDDDLEYMDARGRGYRTKADALRTAAGIGYTHAIGSGTSWDGVRQIPARYR